MDVFRGMRQIAETMGVSTRTIARWVSRYGFPVCKTPSGHYMTTSENIAQWIAATGRVQQQAGELPYAKDSD